MKSCPRCEASIDDAARFCVECGAPQTEDAAAELDDRVRRRAEQVVAESGTGDGSEDGAARTAETGPSDRERLWRRGCYVVGYGTVVVALTRIASPGAWVLLLGGVAILPPVRRLTARPLGSPFKREVMAGIYGVSLLVGVALLALL
ncbi:zinc-ribbon domain-containing protein [Halorubrum sp. JWXQ-INN 858]|uniref:zinc ribbon domain-containing protein n=1 Tax=Halorubrum sp. JWXQ-INN 858 TaxID=2690782 RepID=UPI001356FB74|nr:zinc ribbon domain-containing protein [Halorubrum sp. JWXQ-INN 858]MWV63678.1 zinc-ribbon domain-containing protein [Halorubrum sp. JWXQ-INN 858]